MAGLIESTINASDPNAVYTPQTSPVTAQTYDAQSRTVDPIKDTVQGQLSSIIGANSPYIQQARTAAAQTANSRGLLNSSMAAGAGEAAAIQSALPIAQADASTYGNASQQNQAYENQARGTNTAAINTANQANAAASNTANLAGSTAANAQVSQTLKGAQATTLANIEANYKQLLQSSASAASVFGQTQTNITNLMNDPNTSAAQKQAGVDKQMALLQQALTVFGSISNVDIAGLINFGTPATPAAATPAPAAATNPDGTTAAPGGDETTDPLPGRIYQSDD